MQRSSIVRDQQSSSRIDVLQKAQRRCIRVVVGRIQNHLFNIAGPDGHGRNEWTWHVLLVDHDKKELFLEKCKPGNLDIADYGNLLISGNGNAVPEEVREKCKILVNRFEDDFALVRLQKNTFVETYYVLSNPGKKQEVTRATSCQEIRQHGRILYFTKDEDPPEALSVEILKGQFEDKNFIISDVNFELMLNGTDRNGWTLLHHKARNGDSLTSSDVKDINAQDKICGRKPVHIAAREGHIEAVEFFLNNGSSVNEIDKSGWTLLHYAVWKGNVAMVKFIIEKEPDMKAKDKCMGKQPIHVASEGGHVEVLQILLNNGAGVDDRDGSGRTPIYYAAWEGCLDAAKYLVSRSANVNLPNVHGTKPIHIAADIDNQEMIGFLLIKGAGIEDKNGDGKTVLHNSAENGILNNVRYLVENGANLNAVSNAGETPLACGKKHTEVATYLADKMRDMCVSLYKQRQFGKALDILKDIFDNSGLNCEHLKALRSKCLLGSCISDVGASYDEAVEVLRDALAIPDTPNQNETSAPNLSNTSNGNTLPGNKRFQFSETVFTSSNCLAMFYFAIIGIICRFLIAWFEPGAPI